MRGGSGSLPSLCRPQAGAARDALELFFTLDLEDHLDGYDESSRFPSVVYRLLDLLDETGCKGTFFTVGRAAEAAPALVRAIAARGHELACHSYEHRRLDREEPRRFRYQTAATKDRLEQLGGSAVTGFRAPFFSLMPTTVWATDALVELGFVYSSSVMPGRHPLCGFPDAPRQPFKWSNGLIELPCPILQIGRFALPFLGGPYLRYAPMPLVEWLLARRKGAACLWTYSHPFDFDADEPYARMPDVPAVANFLLWLNRRQMFGRMRTLLRHGSAVPLAHLVARAGFQDTLPVFSTYDAIRPEPPANAAARPGGIPGRKSADSTPA